jgi:hypothetical protein
MNSKPMRYLILGAGALVLALLLTGTPLKAVLPYLFLLACPLMMVFMMRGMGGHSGHGGQSCQHDVDGRGASAQSHEQRPVDSRADGDLAERR